MEKGGLIGGDGDDGGSSVWVALGMDRLRGTLRFLPAVRSNVKTGWEFDMCSLHLPRPGLLSVQVEICECKRGLLCKKMRRICPPKGIVCTVNIVYT